jgi:hypothetical protein
MQCSLSTIDTEECEMGIKSFIKNSWPFSGLYQRYSRNKQYRLYLKNRRLNGKAMYYTLLENYREQTGRELDLSNPRTYDEKIQWSKLFDSTPIKTRLADKYLVRDWIKEKIGEKYLTKLYGVWDRFDDIDFDSLPDSFVLKTNHGSKFNYIVPDKSRFKKSDARWRFNIWMKINYAYSNGFEMHYRDIKPKIIAEEYLSVKSGELPDYKISCFGGKPYVIQFLTDRSSTIKIAAYDSEWNKLDLRFGAKADEIGRPKPECLDEMVRVASILSEGFNFVRVDLYVLDDNSIRFGEMTFAPASGHHRWREDEDWDLPLGNLYVLPEKYYLDGIDYSFEELI